MENLGVRREEPSPKQYEVVNQQSSLLRCTETQLGTLDDPSRASVTSLVTCRQHENVTRQFSVCATMSTPTIFKCYVIGDEPNKVFSVKIGTKEIVAALKFAIKAEKPDKFHQLDANDLDLWAVSIPLDENFSEISRVPEDAQELGPFQVLGTLCQDMQDDHVHILIGDLPCKCEPLPMTFLCCPLLYPHSRANAIRWWVYPTLYFLVLCFFLAS